MNTDQIAKAQALAAEWWEKHNQRRAVRTALSSGLPFNGGSNTTNTTSNEGHIGAPA